MTRKTAFLAALLAGGSPSAATAVGKLVHVGQGGDTQSRFSHCAPEIPTPDLSSPTRERARRFHAEVTVSFWRAVDENQMREDEALHQTYLRRGSPDSADARRIVAQAQAEWRRLRDDYQRRYDTFLETIPEPERREAQWIMGCQIVPPTPLPPRVTLTAPPAPPVPPPPPPPSPPWRKLMARTPLDLVFSDEDYPPAALAAHQAGTVEVGLEVGANGRVSRCWVLRSSGSAALDAATCRLAKSRGRFTPATDGAGNSVPAQTTFTRSWRLPK